MSYEDQLIREHTAEHPPDESDLCPVCDRLERNCECPPEELNAEATKGV